MNFSEIEFRESRQSALYVLPSRFLDGHPDRYRGKSGQRLQETILMPDAPECECQEAKTKAEVRYRVAGAKSWVIQV